MTCQQVREEAAVALLTGVELGASGREHLRGCEACRLEIDGLVPLPQLLALAAPVGAVVPDELLLRRVLVSAARERRARRRWGLLVAVAAVALLVVPLAWFASGRVPEAANPSAPSGPVVTASGTDASTGVVGTVEVRPSALGSALTMSVHGVAPGTRCALVVVDMTGASSTVTTWQADYQGTAEVEGQVSTPLAEISAVELRDVGTHQVLWTEPLSG
jgi:predicted anti-sigma-YlaC factor YlaD